MQPLIKLLILLVIAYAAILLLVWLFGDRLIYFPNYPGRLSGDWHPEGLPIQEAWLRTADGVKLHSWWIPAEGEQFTFLVFHGNAANIANRADLYRFLRNLPANVLAVEYRGYGRSEGQPSEAGIYQDAVAAWEYAVHNFGISPNQLIAFGASMGTAVAVDLAANRDVAGVVLVAPFASSKAVARRVYPFLPGSGFVVPSRFDTGAKLTHVRAPIFIAHCTGDPVLPFALGEEVYRLAPKPKVFLRVEGSCHEEALLMEPVAYRDQLLSFLRQIETGT
jgi:fermentation-respiration switch protein FrsA (DUF1100 family)